MIIRQRQEALLALVRRDGFCDSESAARALNVSVQTIKRDFLQLEQLGQLRRVRGGATLPEVPAQPDERPEKPAQPDGPAIDWYNPAIAPFRLLGFPFFERDGLYRRYPLRLRLPLPAGTEAYANSPSGGQIRFRARTAAVALRVRLRAPYSPSYNVMPLLSGGFDIYASDGDGRYTLIGVSKYDPRLDSYESVLCSIPLPDRPLDFIINFPINETVESVLVGVDRGCEVLPPLPLPEEDRGKILVYGGSILHGFCASRPGMTMTSQLSRRLGREIYNLAVNGNGKCEDETAYALRECEGVRWLILSPEGNCPTVDWLDEHMRSFIRIVRETRPEWNIAVMSFMREARERFQTDYRALRLAKRDCQRKIVEDFRAAGDRRIVFWDGGDFTGADEDIMDGAFSQGEECTADFQHKSDMGFFIMTRAIEKRLRAFEAAEVQP